MPRVAIVIVNYKGFEYSRECIDSVLKIDYPDFAVVFVDNGSGDGSGEKISGLYGKKIVFLPLPQNRGVTGGNNVGIDYALECKFDYVLFLNNDTLVEPNLLKVLVDTSVANGGALAAPKIICCYDRSRLDHWIGPEFNWWSCKPFGYKCYPLDGPQYNLRQEAKVASTCCLLVPCSVIRDIGKMDENYFMYLDDADFTLRAISAGYRMFYEPATAIYHKCNVTTRQQQPSYFEYYLIHRNYFYFYNKLCKQPVVKYLALGRYFALLLLHLGASFVLRRRRLHQVVKLVLKDILARRMGPLPASF